MLTPLVVTWLSVTAGAPRAGKSSLVARLRTADGVLPPHLEADSHGTKDGKGKALDLGMSYEVMDVRDEGDEGGQSRPCPAFARSRQNRRVFSARSVS